MMIREPAFIPAVPGVYALVNRKRRFAYVAYTSNLQKRSHSMSHMLMSQDDDKKAYWPIADLPKHDSDEFAFIVLARDVAPDKALAAIAVAQRSFENKNYRVIQGHRAASPTVTVAGKRMSLAEAVREHGRKNLKYLTAYRRIERGWTVKQALGLDPPDPRWHKAKQDERRERVA